MLLLVPASRVGAQDSEAVEQSRFERWRERVYTSGTVELEWAVETRDGDAQKFELQILPEIAARVGGRMTVIVDSGFRRGSDVIKALALGADLVMAGRPTLYGTAAAGEAGAYRALEIFHEEMDRVMALLGLHNVDEIGHDCLWQPPSTAQPNRAAAE